MRKRRKRENSRDETGNEQPKEEELDDITEDEDGNLTAGVAEVLLRKNRNGPTGKVKLKFIERFAKFADMSSNDEMTTNKFQSKANGNFNSEKNDPF